MIFICDFCGLEFDKPPAMIARNKTKCCSVACSKKLIESQKITKTCKQCGCEFKIKRSHSYQKCCSKKCSAEYKSLNINGSPVLSDGKLLCLRCGEHKSYSEFYDTMSNGKNSKRSNKFKYCKICHQIIGTEGAIKRRSTIGGSLSEILKRTKCNCKRKQIDYDISLEYLLELFNIQDGKCAISGQTLENATYYNPRAVSIDRIDPRFGYTKDNIQLVCWVVNQMKNDLLKEDLIYWCDKIIKNQQNG